MTTLKTALCLTLPLLFLVSCSDSNKPSKEKFAAAIQEALKKTPGAAVCGSFTSPLEKRTAEYKTSARQSDFFKDYDVLAEKGYLTIKNMPADAENFEPYIRVAVTDKFIKDFGEPQSSSGFFMTTAGEINVCYGEAQFKEVTDFTEPSEEGGMKVSRADYTVTRSLKTGQPWLKDQKLLDTLGLKLNLQEEKRQALLILKDSGWVVAN